MAISQNGYSVYGSSSGLSDFKWITGRVRPGDTTVVLDYLASRFNNEVEAIRKDWSWGYAFRAIRGKTSGYSNHASGTAVDFNAPKHALGRYGTFTATQRNRIHAILRDMDQVVRWGGDYSGRKDEMHFEVNVNAARLREFADKVRSKTAPGLGGTSPKPTTWKPTSGPISLELTNNRFKAAYDGKKVARTSGIGLIQKALNAKTGTRLVVDGYAGKTTLAAYAAYERKLKGAGKSNVATVDPDVLKSLGLKVLGELVAKPPAWKPTAGPISVSLTNNRFAAAYDNKLGPRTSGVGLIQQALNAKAGAKLTVDGLAGKATLAAYAAYEQRVKGAGKSNTRTVDPDILRRLGLEVLDESPKGEDKPSNAAPVSFKIASANVKELPRHDKTIDKTLSTAVKGIDIVGWQELSNVVYRDALRNTDAKRMQHVIRDSIQKGAYNSPISFDKTKWRLTKNHGTRQFVDGASGICTDRHISWAELENIANPGLHVIMTSRHQVPAAFSPSGKPRLIGTQLKKRLHMWNRGNDIDQSLLNDLAKLGHPMIMAADQNRQKISAYPAKIAGRRVQAVAAGLDWLHVVDGTKYTWSVGERELRDILSDHKELILPVKLTPSSVVK